MQPTVPIVRAAASPRQERRVLGKLAAEVAGEEPDLHLEDAAVAHPIAEHRMGDLLVHAPLIRTDEAGLTDAERQLLGELDLEKLREMFEQRLKEQKERHDRGNRWVGTAGTSPFGNSGRNPNGIRVGAGGQRSAMQVAEERRFKEYRKDVVLDVRQIDVALRGLRKLGR